MSVPLISIALPVRNGANYLAAALDSILAQSFTDFELHVSDNASDDETPAVLAQYAARDLRVKVSRSDELIPQAANVNRAVRLCPSPWIKLFCHDDLMREDCLSEIAKAIGTISASIGLIGNGERYLFGNGYLAPAGENLGLVTVGGHEAIARKLWEVKRAVPFPALTTATVRRDAFEAAGGFDPRYLYFDLFCWLQLLLNHDYAMLHAPLTINRIHAGQVAVQARASLREVADLRAFLPDFARRHEDDLGMSAKARLRVRLIPAAFGAKAVAGDWIAGRRRRALHTFFKLPPTYWPLLPLLVVRAVRLERVRLGALAAHVPPELLYPA